jgi:transposase
MCKDIDSISLATVKWFLAMRSRASIQELANYFGVSRQTIHAWLRKYNVANKVKYNPKDMNSVFEFFEYLQRQFHPL